VNALQREKSIADRHATSMKNVVTSGNIVKAEIVIRVAGRGQGIGMRSVAQDHGHVIITQSGSAVEAVTAIPDAGQGQDPVIVTNVVDP